MTYASVEASRHSGYVAELYEFTLGATTWRQTSSVDSVTYLGNVYTPYPLERQAVERTGELSRSAVNIDISSDNPIAELFIITNPEQLVSVRIYTGHRDDGEYQLEFSGRVLACQWEKNHKAQLHCEPVITSMQRSALKLNFNPVCPYTVYSSKCAVTRTNVAGTLTAVNGSSVSVDTASTITNGRLIGGTITLGTSIRTITSHSGDNLTLTAALDSASVGDAVTMNIGCDKSMTACNDWHNNILNYGGEPYISSKNPFIGRIV